MKGVAPIPLAQALFAPRSIALIGASGDAGKNTSRPQRFLRKHGYTGAVLPINPGRDEIFGEKAYPDLRAVTDAGGPRLHHGAGGRRPGRDRPVLRETGAGRHHLQRRLRRDRRGRAPRGSTSCSSSRGQRGCGCSAPTASDCSTCTRTWCSR